MPIWLKWTLGAIAAILLFPIVFVIGWALWGWAIAATVLHSATPAAPTTITAPAPTLVIPCCVPVQPTPPVTTTAPPRPHLGTAAPSTEINIYTGGEGSDTVCPAPDHSMDSAQQEQTRSFRKKLGFKC